MTALTDAIDQRLAPVWRRLNMMFARGTLNSVTDTGGIQTMQVGLLADETADAVERLQTYGLSSVPPAGSEVVVAFLGGYREHPHVVAVNDRGPRPKGLRGGETCLYNDQDVTVLLTADGDLAVDARRDITVKSERDITLECQGTIRLRASAIEMEQV